MNYQEYRDAGEELYCKLARIVRGLLESALEASDAGSRCQAIHHRGKSHFSLRHKLELRGLLEAEDIESEIKDLAGCRLVFYTNLDVNRFLNSRVIVDNFEVDWDRSRIHEPIAEDDSRYSGTHYTVTLKPEVLAEEGMAVFAGKRCEIQIQTILNHAWAETAHDIVYKGPSLDGYGTNEFQSIVNRLNRVMNDQLKPAGYEIQKAQSDFESLMAGRSIYEAGSLDGLERCENNNQRYELLEKFRDYVLPNYDDVVSAFPEIRQQLVNAIKSARDVETQDIETPFGNFSGRSHVDVASVALDILERLRYLDVDQSLAVLFELYSTSTSEAETERLIKAAESLAGHNLDVWRKYGPVVQRLIVDHISRLERGQMVSVLPLIAAVLGEVLSPTAESTSAGFDSFTFQRGSVLPSEELAAIRNSAIKVLTSLYEAVGLADRRQLQNALWNATRSATDPPESEDLDVIVLDNSVQVVDFFRNQIGSEGYDALQKIETRVFWLARHFSGWADGSHEKPKRKAAAISLMDAIGRFRERVDQDDEYRIYKLLVGFDSIFPHMWDDLDLDHRREKAYREEQIRVLIASFDPQYAADWKTRIEHYGSIESSDGATFLFFGNFLRDMAASQPGIFRELIAERANVAARFLPSIYEGLQQSAPDELAHVMQAWCDDAYAVDRICRALRFAPNLDLRLLESSLSTAIEHSDRIAVLETTALIFNHKGLEESGLRQRLLRTCFDYLNGIADTTWIHEVWHLAEGSVTLNNLTADDANVILMNLLQVPQIEFHTEAILKVILRQHPALVIGMLGQRVRYELQLEEKDGYSAIPYEFYEIGEALQAHLDELLTLSVELFAEDRKLFQYRGGRLLSIVFPEFSSALDDALVRLVRSGDENNIDFVLHIMRNYKGQAFLHNLCKEVVEALEPDHKLLAKVSIILDSTPTVSGEFGMRDAYVAKKGEIEPWLTDERDKVRSFAERQLRSLDRQIAAEHRRAEEDLEMRRRDYDDNE